MANMDAFAISPSVYTLVVAPRRAGSKTMNLLSITMSSPNKTQQTSSNQSNKRKLSDSSDDEGAPVKVQNKSIDNYPKFIVLKSLNEEKPITKISPFVLHKTIQSVAGEVKRVTKLKNGSVLIECIRQKQSQNLLSLTAIFDLPISSTPHRTLNYSQGIIRDRDHDLSNMSEEEICNELKNQNITKVKRFTKKSEGKIIQLSTYLVTFEQSTLPSHIYLGPYRIKVDPFVPNPTRCFKCQKFGHGKSSCRGTEKCVKCSGVGHSSFDCEGEVKCANCGSNHMANSRHCDIFKREMNIQKIKTEKNISYQEAKKLISFTNDSTQPTSYADKLKGKPTTRTFETQTVYAWPNGFEHPILVSEISSSHSTSSSQTSSNTQAFNHNKIADINGSKMPTSTTASHTKQRNRSSPNNSNTYSNEKRSGQSNSSTKSPAKSTVKQPGQANSSPGKNVKSNSRSASAEKTKTFQNSNRLKKAEKSLLHQNQYDVLSADDADNEEVMDTSTNEQIQSVWGDYPNRGRQADRTRDGGRFTSCSPGTDERRHGKISPIRAPPK